MITIRLLTSHYEHHLKINEEFGFQAEEVISCVEDGVALTDVIFDEAMWGRVDEENQLRSSRTPYDFIWENIDEIRDKSGEGYLRIDAADQYVNKTFTNGDRYMISMNDVIEAHAHGAVQTLIENMAEKFDVISWRKQVEILNALGRV